MNTKITRCLLENDLDIDTGPSGQYEDFENDYGITPQLAFDHIVIDCSRLKHETWKAIKASDEIWMYTSFYGNSGSLLFEMLEMAIANGIRDKVVINISTSEFLSDMFGKSIDLIHQMQLKNNIKFVFSNDLEFEFYAGRLKNTHIG